MKKIALFGGSFDPPHLGHQLVISYLMGSQDLDELWVIPTYKHALGKNLISFTHRYQMVLRMVKIFAKNVSASAVEQHIAMSTPDYVDSRTINTVRFIKSRQPDYEFRLVIGSDLVEQSQTWDNWDEIEKLAPPLIVGRMGYGPGDQLDEPFALPNISSSEIKARVAQGSINELVPRAVADYIQMHGLYRDAFEEAFHRSRRMFVYLSGMLRVADEGDERSHEKWFDDEGWTNAMDTCVRGFWDHRGVFLYIGKHWEHNKMVDADAPKIVRQLKRHGCPSGLQLFGGMVPGVPGVLWTPRCRLDLVTL